MDKVTLGRSGLKVTPLALGTWQLSGEWGSFDEREAIAAIRHARELGINFFDTAQAYGFGRSEQLLGAALADELRSSRDEVVISTKGGLRRDGNRLVRDSSPQWLRQGVESSLKALGVDFVDLYQVHWPDPNIPLTETAGALDDLVSEGKIRHVGVSNFDVQEMRELAAAGPLETVQPPYHMFRQQIETDILPYARSQDIGVLVYGPLAHGLLTGTMSPNTTFAADDWRAESGDFRGETLRRNLNVVDKLKGYADELGVALPVLAVAWTLANADVDVAIVGARRARHLDEIVQAGDVHLTQDSLAGIDRILANAAPVHGPAPEGMPK